MAKDKETFKVEEKMKAAQAAEIIREIADGVEAGSLTLANGKETTLELPSEVTFELELEEEVQAEIIKQSLEIEIEWLVSRK